MKNLFIALYLIVSTQFLFAQNTEPATDVHSGQKIIDTTAKLTTPETTALSFPGMSGPITLNPAPLKFGNIYLSGVVSGLVQFQNNAARGDRPSQADISNGQIFIQKNSGVIQFFIEAGTYSMPDIGVPYLRSNLSTKTFYGIVPQAPCLYGRRVHLFIPEYEHTTGFAVGSK
jgi:hypothetical protein